MNQANQQVQSQLQTFSGYAGTKLIGRAALGRMVEQNRSGAYTQIVYAPRGQKFAVTNGQTLQKAFLPLPSRGLAVYNSSGLLYYGHSDHLGSIRLASTTSRTMYFDLAHAPFGEIYASSGSTDPAFTSQRQDTVSGLYDFPAREYSIQGRWPSPDPAGLAAVDPSNPQSWNRYAYVGNNPMNAVDPSGLDQCPTAPLYDGGCLIFGGGGLPMTCYQDSVATDCGQVLRNIDLGTAAPCPKNDCTGIKAGQGPGGTTVFQQWTPGGCVSTQDSRSRTGDSTCYAGYWTTVTFSKPLTYDARLQYFGSGVVKGAGVVGSPKHIVGFYLASALLGDVVAGGQLIIASSKASYDLLVAAETTCWTNEAVQIGVDFTLGACCRTWHQTAKLSGGLVWSRRRLGLKPTGRPVMAGVPRAPFQCPICRSLIPFVRTSAREPFPCPSCGVHLRIPSSYFLLTGVISVLLSAVLLAGVGLDLFWSMIAFAPILLAVLGIVHSVATRVAAPKLEVAGNDPGRPNLSLFH